MQTKYLKAYREFLPDIKKQNREQAKATCPFHDDKNPSLSIKLSDGLFHCFGCEKSGNFEKFKQLLSLNAKAKDEVFEIPSAKWDTQKKISQADRLFELASAFKLFHDDAKTPFAFHDRQVFTVLGDEFKHLLTGLYWKTHKKVPNCEAIRQALGVISAMCIHQGKTIPLHVRVAEKDGALFYDLGNRHVVKVTEKGWGIIKDAPILFHRYAHQLPQDEPQKGGQIENLFDFINLKSDEHKLLCAVYLITCFIPNIPHPIFHPWGAQGSGKTTLCKILKSLVDPSKVDSLIPPQEDAALVQILTHHYLPVLDNMSSLSDRLSDTFCRATSGVGFSKRQHRTNDDDFIYYFRRCIIINGITPLSTKPDLMDRTILFHLERVDAGSRKEERKMYEKFQQEKPFILGAIFDVLSSAMKIYPQLKPKNLPRMADFAQWGIAVTKALGKKGEDFIAAYKYNIENQNEAVFNENTLLQRIIWFMDDKEYWTGTVQELYEMLKNRWGAPNNDPTFPKYSNKLRGQLERIRANLLDYSITYELPSYHTKRGVPITFRKGGNLSSPSTSRLKDTETLGEENGDEKQFEDDEDSED